MNTVLDARGFPTMIDDQNRPMTAKVGARTKNLLGFKTPVGTNTSLEYILALRSELNGSKFHSISRGLKAQGFYDARERLAKKLEQKKSQGN